MIVEPLAKPALESHQLRIKTVASRVNPVDIDLMNGMPFISYKNPQIGGIDGAGKVVEVGDDVSDVRVGDEVFYYRKFTDIGTWGEEIVIDGTDIAPIPTHLSAQDAGAIALPLLTAFAALQQLEAAAGSSILIHGAAGGVGLQATQLALHMGLDVTATASKRDTDMLLELGVTQVIDYRANDFAEVLAGKKIDYVFDVIGGETLLKSLELASKAVVSTSYPDVDSMDKTGIRMPGILKTLMRLSTSKFPRKAKKFGVKLLGQVTGPDAALMQQASTLASQGKFRVPSYPTVSLSQIEQEGMQNTRVGSVILFQA